MTVELFDIFDTQRMAAALAVRTRVFVDEQGVPPAEEIDAHDRSDPTAMHALARDGGETVGASRYYVVDDATVQIGRMAVLETSRGKRIGTALLAALVDEAVRHGFARAHLHAQTHAREFYVRAGFHDDGEPLWDGGILHQPMSRDLAASRP